MAKMRKCRTCGKPYCPMKAKSADRSRCYLCQRTPEQAERDRRNQALGNLYRRSRARGE
jgi:hypothetical protein